MGPRVRIRFPPGKSQANFPTALTRPNRSHLRAQGIHLRPRPKSAAVSDFVDPELGNVPHIRTPVKIGESVRVRTLAPKLGQHNAEIFGRLGLSEAEMTRLREQGVL